MSKIGSSGVGKASSQTTGLGANTVNANVRDGSEKASNSSMKVGKGSGASKGLRGTFLAGPASVGYHQVSAGTAGPANNKAGTGLPLATAPSTGKPAGAPTTLVHKSMKVGKGSGATKGTHKGWL